MAELGTVFNAADIAPASFDVLPAGEYPVHIIESDRKPTKAGDGDYLQLTLEVLEGEYKGRRVWDRLNLNNPNPQAVQIAQRALSAICHSIGVMSVSDSEQLHYKPLVAVVKVIPAGADRQGVQRDAQNAVRSYKTYDGASNGGGNGGGSVPGRAGWSRT